MKFDTDPIVFDRIYRSDHLTWEAKVRHRRNQFFEWEEKEDLRKKNNEIRFPF
jgi:hypothetical protein